MDISIVIVSWRVKNLLRVSLDSVFQQIKNLNFEVFVIDNNSNDGTFEMVKKEFPKVTIINNNKNLGFAKACNQAIKKSSGKYILLLNPDTKLIDSSISNLVQYMEQNTKVGIAGGKILNTDGSIQPSVRSFPTLLSHIYILLKLHHFFPNSRPLNRYYCPQFDYESTKAVDQVMGAFFMIRRQALLECGLLDQHFFTWYEEVDLCKRFLQAGWKTYFVASARIMHHKGKSFNQLNPVVKQVLFNRSMLYYFFKHHSIFSYLLLLLLYPISLLLSGLIMISRYITPNKNV